MHETRWLQGTCAPVEVLLDHAPEPLAQALILHPHPKLGGDARHKVPFMIARTLAAAGLTCWRPSLPHAGMQTGTHDGSGSEVDDLGRLLEQMRLQHERLPLIVVGFSFGAHLAAHLAGRLPPGIEVAEFMLCGLPVGPVYGQRHYETPAVPGAFVVHGEQDQSVPLQQVLSWAAPQGCPVTVIPRVDHFFSGRLPALAQLLAERASFVISGVGPH